MILVASGGEGVGDSGGVVRMGAEREGRCLDPVFTGVGETDVGIEIGADTAEGEKGLAISGEIVPSLILIAFIDTESDFTSAGAIEATTGVGSRGIIGGAEACGAMAGATATCCTGGCGWLTTICFIGEVLGGDDGACIPASSNAAFT